MADVVLRCDGGLEGEYNLVSSSKPQQCMCNHIQNEIPLHPFTLFSHSKV